MISCDLIVLGYGTAGMNLVTMAAADGWKTAIVEASNIGGTSINDGCIPSKALISSARVMQTVRNARKFGVIATPPQADWAAMVDRKEQLIERIRIRSSNNVEENDHITLYEGQAVFTGTHTVEVDGVTLTAKRIVISTGARSAVPLVTGLSDIDYLTSTSVMEMKELPGSLLILGGGLIALEFSQLFARLGVEVTIIQRGDRLAENLEPEISREIRNVLESAGINVKINTNISSAGSEAGSVYIVDETDNGPVRYSAAQILVATGRAPNSDMLALGKAGVETNEEGYVVVDEGFKTNTEGIWAIGDVIGGMMFTDKARHDALLLSRYFLKGEKIVSKDRLIPFSIYTDPEIAVIGMGEATAVKAGYKIKVQRFPLSLQGLPMAAEKMDGFVKLVLDSDRGKILGAHIIGPEAGTLVHELSTAMRFGATVYDLQNMIHVHPTLCEAITRTAWSE